MKKKIFLLGAIIVLMLSFSISVSADELYTLTLDGVADKMEGSEWADGYQNDYSYYEIKDEKIHMYATMDAEGKQITLSMKIPFGVSANGETLIYYDVMFPSGEEDCKAPVGMQFFLGNNRATTWHYPTAFVPGEWYNIMIHVDAEQKNVYYRSKLASSDTWSSKQTGSTGIASNQGATGFKAYIQPTGDRIDKNRGEVYFDNIRVIQNLYLEDFKFMLDDTEINSVADITADGTVKAVFDATNYDIDFNSEDIVPDYKMLTPMLVAFDKDGMMLDCEIYNDVELDLYENPGLEFGLDISSIREQLSGGKISLYIWDSIDNMEAVFDEFVLPATAAAAE